MRPLSLSSNFGTVFITLAHKMENWINPQPMRSGWPDESHLHHLSHLPRWIYFRLNFQIFTLLVFLELDTNIYCICSLYQSYFEKDWRQCCQFFNTLFRQGWKGLDKKQYCLSTVLFQRRSTCYVNTIKIWKYYQDLESICQSHRQDKLVFPQLAKKTQVWRQTRSSSSKTLLPSPRNQPSHQPLSSCQFEWHPKYSPHQYP